MKIEVNLSKKNVFFAILGIFIFTGLIFVIAYNPSFSGGNGIIFGHSADEVNVKMVAKTTTAQSLLDNFYGKAECKIDLNEIKTGGCPAGSYLYKVNTAGDSFCKYYFTDEVITLNWCYPENHGVTPPTGGTTYDRVCGVCNTQERGQVCCVSALICTSNGWQRQSGPSNLWASCQ